MFFYSVFIFGCLFASAVLAAPHEHQNLPRSGASGRAGGILSSSPGSFQTVTGDFEIPYIPQVANTYAAIVIGVDGATCAGGSLSGQVILSVDQNGFWAIQPLVVWSDEASYTPGIAIEFGDTIEITVTADQGGMSGTVVFQNLSKGTSASQPIQAQNTANQLCMQDAFWGLQPILLIDANGLMFSTIPNFGEVRIEDATATGPGGSYSPAEGATAVNIQENGQDVTSTQLSEATADIHYTGP